MATGYNLRALVGLGNPGPDHAPQRHNIGFWLADALAREAGETFKLEKRLHGDLAKVKIAGQELFLLKPQTFMNVSGRSVQALAAYYKIRPEEMLVVHDELDLPVGTTRIKRGGGHGGHNGLRDISAQLGQDYCRLRMGIGHPGDKRQVIGYVLSRPAKAEQALLEQEVTRALDIPQRLITQGWDRTAQWLHTALG